jgi:membrane protease YdiL (CAAX protease family)
MSTTAHALRRPVAPRWLIGLVVAAGAGALLLRTLSYGSIVATGLVGLAGIVPPVARERRAPGARILAVVAVGAGAFLAARFVGVPIGIRLTRAGIASIVIAAIAEEAFFRRFLFDRLSVRGGIVAVAVPAGMFALIHLPLYGAGALGINLAAGLLLGWQRWSGGTWLAPAVTHVLANLLQMG